MSNYTLEDNELLVRAMDELGITREMAEKQVICKITEPAIICAAKELVGMKLLKKYKLFDELFPENTGYKLIKSKKLQKAGVDYEVYLENGSTIYVDLKSNVGRDYHMAQKDIKLNATPDQLKDMGLVIELYQYGLFSQSSSKLTDYQLHITYQDDGIYFALVPYSFILERALEHKKTYKVYGELAKPYWPGDYIVHDSLNGTGQYIKVSYNFTKLR